jgi:thiol:disulfide interchange protein DsbD
MGLVAGPIAAPCTGPFLVDVVAHVAATGYPVLGAAVLFTYAHGIGLLFFVLAVSAVSLPKSGPWLDGVKGFCAILLFVGAVYFLRPIFPALEKVGDPRVSFLFGSLFLAALGFALGAVHLSFLAGSWTSRLRKGVGILLAVVGLTGAVAWYFTPERELGWRHDEATAFAEARQHNLHVLVDFGANWCEPCKLIEKIMAEEDVYQELGKSFVLLQFDVSEVSDANDALKARYQAGGLPTVLFLDSSGAELARYNNQRPSKETFVQAYRKVLSAYPPDQ